eukprot:171611-Prymnesium_polylepis.1
MHQPRPRAAKRDRHKKPFRSVQKACTYRTLCARTPVSRLETREWRLRTGLRGAVRSPKPHASSPAALS